MKRQTNQQADVSPRPLVSQMKFDTVCSHLGDMPTIGDRRLGDQVSDWGWG